MRWSAGVQAIAAGVLSLGLLASQSAQAGTLSAADLTLLDRVTWGINESSVQAMQAMGREKFLQWQLHPTATDILPAAAQAQIAAMTISLTPLPALVAELAARKKLADAVADPEQKKQAQQAYQQDMTKIGREAAARDILRNLYSPAQLREQMTWFWFNHFNVHQYKADIRLTIADYQDRTIRPHALGRFRDLLAATVRSPAMLRYLDNADNYAGHINENYAREIMELHTLGVGSGYTQQDVQELARILTGLGVDAKPENPRLKPELQPLLVRDGMFEFNPARHDFGDKIFLGHAIPGSGLAEVDTALDLLSRSPATARHLSREMAIFFMGDTPPDPIVAAMTDSFQHTDGDIAAVLNTMFHAPGFAAASAERFKDPMHYVLSAVRLAYDQRVILNTIPVQNWLNRLAQGLFNKDTPDGYPMQSAAWNGPGQMATRFEIARQIGSGPAGLFKPDQPGATDQPGFPQLQNALFYDRLRQTLSPTTLAALSQAISQQDWNTLFLSAPEFMY